MSLGTPLKRVRGLGSAKEGADHFWLQRVTAVANVLLVCFFIGLVLRLIGQSHGTVKAALASPLVSVPLLLLILSATIHMRLGMQTIIEDYVTAEGRKIAALLANTFFAIVVGLVSVYSVLKLSFGV